MPSGLRVSDSAQVAGDVAVDIAPAAEAADTPVYSLANPRTRWYIGELVALLVIGAFILWLRRSSMVVQEHQGEFQSTV